MRTVAGGDGRQWEVFVEWEGRRVSARVTRRFRERREARAANRGENHALDLLDGCINLGGAESLAVLAIGSLAVLLFAAFGPWVLALLLGVVEFGLVVLVVGAGFGFRTLFRRPWRVAAVSHQGEVWAWHQVGFGAARELVHTVADQLAMGAGPEMIASGQLEAGCPHQIPPGADLGVVARPGVQIAAVVVSVSLLVAAVIVAIVGLL